MSAMEPESSGAQSIQNDVQGAINMGRQAAQTAKTAQKAAAQIAAGNVAGAAASVVKDPQTAKKLLIIALIPILFFSMITVFFLYALPSSIYEAVTSYVEQLGENIKMGIYGGEHGSLGNLLTSTGKAISGAVSDVFSSIKGLFAKSEGDVDDEADLLTEEGSEIFIAQNEADQKITLERKIDACVNKLDVRAKQIKEAIVDNTPAIESYFSSRYASQFDEWGGTTVSVYTNGLSTMDALKILSAYTASTGASLQDMQLSDLMKWLGYYNEFSIGHTKFNIGGENSGIVGSVKPWKGTFIPQYLVEQREYEVFIFGEEQTNFDDYMCPLVDLILVVDCPDFSTITPDSYQETRTREAESIEGVDGGDTADSETYTVTVGYVNVSISVKTRDVDNFAGEVMGLWSGSLSGDGKPDYNAADTGSGIVADAISDVLDQTNGKWSVYYENLTNGEIVSRSTGGGGGKMVSASLIKLWIMATVYDEADKGRLTLTQDIKEDLNLMITQSDNDATNRLIDKVGMSTVNSYARKIGCSETALNRKMLESGTENYTSAADCGTILKLINSGLCVTSSYSAEMKTLLFAQQRRNKIPAGLTGTTASVGNKTGELFGGTSAYYVENDAAIIVDGSNIYLLCVMSELSSGGNSTAISAIGQLSRAVYNAATE